MKSRLVQINMLIFFLIFVPTVTMAQQQIDTNYITLFNKSNVVEVYPGIYSTRFNFTTPRERGNDYSLVANSSGFVGLYFGYKWISLKYSWTIPGTELAKNVKLQSTALGFSFGMRTWSFRPFYDSYKGLLTPEKPGSRDYRAFRDIAFTDAGADLYYFFNTKRFSFRAANSYSEKQIQRTGSLFIKVTPMWQKINWEEPSRNVIPDSTTFTLLSYDPEWFSLIARIGYSYNFIFKKGKWSIAPAVLVGGGALKELNTGIDHLQLVTDIQTWVRMGYNHQDYYIYLNARWGNLRTNLFIKNMNQVNQNLSLTGGYRFASLKKKILRIL